MRSFEFRHAWRLSLRMALFLAAGAAFAQTRTLRIVTYNIEADVSTNWFGPLPGLIAPPGDTNNTQAGGVLEGIGEEVVNGNAQPLDILALEETTTNSLTVVPIVNGLNSFYGVAGMYSYSTYQATQFGGSTNNGSGNGPNALVYNARTVQLLASVPVDPPGGVADLGSASGEYREVMRYKFAPAGVTASSSNVFYVYVSHYKASSGSSNEAKRRSEAQIIRTNEAIDLPATARVLYVGDYNVDTSGEAGYQTILSNTAPNGIQQGQGIDPLNPAGNPNINWSANTSDTNILFMLSEHDYNLEYRDDLQLMTTNVYYGAPGGLKYMPGTYHVFANNGLIPYYGTVNSGTNTALNNRLVTNGPVFISAAQLYLDLTNASDHLPVVADYTVPVPAPVISAIDSAGTNLVISVTNGITNAVYVLLGSTNLVSALTNWTALATSTATAAGFTFTATNAVPVSPPQQFYILQTR